MKSQLNLNSNYSIGPNEWIKIIPTHWKYDRIKWSVESFINGVWGRDKDGDNERICIRVADFDRVKQKVKLDNPTIRSFDENELINRELIKGDLLIEKSGGGEKQLVGQVVEYDLEIAAVCSNFVTVMRTANNQFPRFWAYTHQFLYSVRRNYVSIKQTTGIQNLDFSSYMNEIVCYPPYQEQIKIANFLDQKTSQIDGLIEQKEKLIQLLSEKRTALITQAVTKGLDPDVEMKDSGIDWLGEIPKHWEVKRLRFLVETNPLKSEVALNENELVSFVPMEAVHEYGGLTLDLDKELNEVYSSYTYFKDKDVVVAKITPCFENGKGSIAKGLTNSIGFGTTELHVLRSTKKMNHEFLFYLTISDSFRKIGESWMYGAGGQKRIPEIFIKDLIIPICDIDEQKIIVDRLRKKVKKMHSLTLKIKDSIHKLKEYREALITAAVTGQIKV